MCCVVKVISHYGDQILQDHLAGQLRVLLLIVTASLHILVECVLIWAGQDAEDHPATDLLMHVVRLRYNALEQVNPLALQARLS